MSTWYEYELHGQENQILEIRLAPGQSINTETGAMSYMDAGIAMETSAKHGARGLLRRKIAGESFLVNKFTNRAAYPAALGLSPETPAHIIPIAIEPGKPEIICHRDAYLAGSPDITVALSVNSVRTSALGKAALAMQRIRGHGQAFLAANGAVSEHYIEAGHHYRAEAEAIAAFESTIKHDIAINKGIKNILFSGERIFMLTLTGPGTVWFQSAAHFKIASKHIRQLVKQEPGLLK